LKGLRILQGSAMTYFKCGGHVHKHSSDPLRILFTKHH